MYLYIYIYNIISKFKTYGSRQFVHKNVICVISTKDIKIVYIKSNNHYKHNRFV